MYWGFYEAEPASFRAAVGHLPGMPHVTVERWDVVKDALDLHVRELDFADALRLTCSAGCSDCVSFDERQFVGRAARMGPVPVVRLPS